MSLKKYSSKRKLQESHEPKAKLFKRKKGELEFVVQKHAARQLHYDFRIEVDGVLKSWAIPKGPSLDPNVKRLAIMVEDHPYEYRHFEGVIPSGYGAGTVRIWDHGTYSSEDESIREGLKKGILHLSLHGEKLKGDFSLIKLKKEGNEWLFIKKKESPSLKPMLATLIDEPFDSNEWLFEIKLDGFRALANLHSSQVKLYSRNLKSFNERFPLIVEDLKALKLNAVLDGEIVALDPEGISHFQMLQNTVSEENIFFYVFDILSLDGRDLSHLPLIERKSILKRLLKKKRSHVRYLDHVEERGRAFFELCKKEGCEGIIGKKKKSVYEVDERSKEWVKIKADTYQEVVICGFTEPKGSRKKFGALIAGIYKNGSLEFAGHVGGGFSEEKLKEIKEFLTPCITKKCPFKKPPKTNTSVTWVKPKYCAKVKFKEWTREGIMRQPIFLEMGKEFVTHPEKLYWKKEKITKGDVLSYYEAIAPFILPYLKDRPESLKRFPEGTSAPSFFQKNLETHPDWIKTVDVEHNDKLVHYLLINDLKSLLYAVNMGCIELHPWLSRYQTLKNPDFLLLDLDPEDISFDAAVETAQVIHSILEKINVPSFCKTSGSRGLHILIPLRSKYTFEQSKHFAQLIAILAHEQLPKITSLERSPKNRQKKVYIDCLQNNFGQTFAAPYCIRGKPGMPVSAPLEWNEIKKGLNPLDFTIFNMLDRLKKKGDLFKPLLGRGINMEKALNSLTEMREDL